MKPNTDTTERAAALEDRRRQTINRRALLEQRVAKLLAEGLRPRDILERLGSAAKAILNRRHRL